MKLVKIAFRAAPSFLAAYMNALHNNFGGLLAAAKSTKILILASMSFWVSFGILNLLRADDSF